jgi:signal transduction histidine kinase
VAWSVDTYRPQAQAKHQTLHCSLPPGGLTVLADRDATLQVLDNLISNAIKYSPHAKEIQVHLLSRDGHARLEVRDEGPGLTEADKSQLFGKFARLSARPTGDEASTGLGLSIVKRMVEASHGRIWCESEPGQGATFIVEWPRTG